MVRKQTPGPRSATTPIGHWLAGREETGEPTEPSGPVYNPAQGRELRRVRFAGSALIGQAVDAAADAFPGWAATPPAQRSRVLFRYRELLAAHRDELATLVTEENGKTLAESRAEIDRGVQVVEFAAGIPHLMKGEHLGGVASGLDSYSLREPLGPCLGITPFNFPAMVPLWMFPVAIACGNTFILKPSEKVPSAPMLLAELFEEAGLPPGVFNVLNGASATVEQLIASPRTTAVSFVGSSPVAETVYRAAAALGKRAQCLGGAKNHMVVMPDADLDAACTALTGAAFGCAGERCMAISVAVTVGSAGNALVEKLSRRMATLQVGSGDDPATDVGPLITAEHRRRVERYVEAGVHEGARLVVDSRHTHSPPDEGFFFGPCLFDHVTPQMSIHRDEIFGPVLCIVRAANLDEALSIVNAHEYANGAAIFTRSGAAARVFSQRVSAGMIGVNVPIPAPTAYFGFGGHKRSLFGPLHIHGNDGVRFYTRMKTVTSRWPESTETGPAPSGF